MSSVATQGFRISPEQERLWQLQQESPAYVAQTAIKIEGSLDVAALRTALTSIVDRFEILRTTFRRQAGMRSPLQVISDANGFTWTFLDWSGQSRSEVGASLDQLLAEQRIRTRELETGPLLEAWLATVSADEHYLVLSLPSLCADAQSLTCLFGELARAYTVDAAAEESEPPLQYADFAEWHCQLLDEDEQSPAKAYWREQRIGIASLSSPHRVARSAALERFEVAVVPLPVDADTSLRVTALARQKGVPISDVYLACWLTLAWRLFGETEVVVGAVADERGGETLQGACGLFAITLPVRHRFEDGTRFEEVVETVARSRRAASDWQYDFSWDRAIEGAASGGAPAFLPLAFQFDALPPRTKSGSTSMLLARSFACTDRFQIKVNCVQSGDAVAVEWHFDRNVIGLGEVERLARHYHALLKSAVERPQAEAIDLELLDEAQRREILVGFNSSASEEPVDRCVHERFQEVARRFPDRPALVFDDQVLTYGELDAQATRLSRRLRSLGVGPDVPVALCVDRSPDMIVGILGVLKSGGAYVPLDHTQPAQRLVSLIQDSRAAAVVCQPHLADLFAESAAARLVLGHEAASPFDEHHGDRVSSVVPANLAYTLFTSGSTGTPKGVQIEHRQLLHYVRAVLERLELPPDASFATVSSFAADLGNTAIFPALLSGGCLHIVAQARVMDPEAMAEYGERHRVDCLKIVPSHLGALLSAPRPERVLPRQRLVLGGEASTWDLVSRIEALSAECRLMNHYGPTETTVGVLTYGHERGRQRADESQTVPLGRPISGSRVYILDSRARPVPVGVSGELYIGGAGLARGYANRPEQTAAGFVPDPVSAEPGARVYRTGDLGCYLPDGNIEFLGRADHQVKIRGFRVELGEIESVLREHEAVEAAIVLAREDVPGDKRLAGYVVRRPGAQVTTETLRDHVRERLPEYMVPGAFALLDQLPLNRNGKVDRRALPPIAHVVEATQKPPVPPRNATEERLMKIWADVLAREIRSVHDDFFEAGGHSLLAMQLIVRVREAFHVDLPLPALFDAPTIAGLGEAIESIVRTGRSDVVPEMTRVSRGGPVPLSFAQQRLWFLDQLDPGSTAYNRSFAVRLSGRLGVESLQQSLSELVRRHEVLRTTYPTVDGQAQQVIAAEARLRIRLLDLGHLPAQERENAARRLVAEDSRTPFDLAAGPLVRAFVLRLADTDHVLVLSQHHIGTDAWSNGVLAHEVSKGYQAFAAGVPTSLADLAIQYADYAAWQRQWLEGETLERQLSFWKQELQDAPPSLELPTDHPRPALQSFRGATRSFQLSRELTESLKELSQQEGATLFMTLLAAFQTLLHRYTGQADILVGSPIAGRMRPEVQNLMGFFVNTLVLRADMRGAPAFRQLLAQVRQRSLAAYANQDLPFEKLVDELELERDLSQTPLFQVMFVLQTDALASLRLPGLETSQLATPIENAKFNLTLYMSESGSGLDGALEYDTDLFDESTIARMVGHFETLLEGIAADPDRTVRQLPLLREHERRQLLVDWNATRADYPRESCLHELVEAQVARTPDAVALVFEDAHLTYRELDDRANSLARLLCTQHVGPELLVGVYMERSLELVVGLLAVLKAGGAYVPLDPEYPKARLQAVLDDARPGAVLTQQHLLGHLAGAGIPVYCLDSELARTPTREAARRPVSSVDASHAAYVIYTSGSTGQPKGVLNTHEGICNRLRWMQETYALGGADRVLQKTPATFDVSVWEFFWPIMTGAALVLARPGGHRDPQYLRRTIDAQRITTLHFVPSMLQVFLSDAGQTPGETPALRRVVCSGEALPHDLKERCLAHLEGAELHNLYGPTEAAVDVTAFACRRGAGATTVPIGRPVANTSIFVLDGAGQPVPIGVAGELHIGGVQLARIYLNRPALTAEKFVPDPFAERPGARLYRTGDLTRYLGDGNIEFLGRIDFQVKIRGFRIELGEIEAALAAHPAVREAIVLAREDQPDAKRLVAYLTPAAADAPSVSDLRSHLKARLPEYMVPSSFVVVEAFPLTSSGKVDRRALPRPESTRPDLEEAFVPPRNPVEQSLADIWCRVLGLERVGIHDSFFDLGGDSILSIQIVSRANQAGLRLSARQIFEHQTIAGLAQAAGTAPAIRASQGLVTGTAPLTAIQRWFFEQAFVDPHHFNQSVLLRTSTPLDPEWLKRAIEALLAHHDALRLRFIHTDSGWQQEDTAGTSATVFSRVDLSNLTGAGQRSELEAVAARLQGSLALDAGPQLRVALFDLGEPGQRLFLVIHHLVVDGVSWRILLEDLQTAYEQIARGQAVRLPPKTTSYADWARRCAEHARSGALEDEMSYWLSVRQSPAGRLPMDDPQGANTVASAGSMTVALNAAETEALLRDVPNVYRTQINDVLLTAVTQAFTNWTGEGSVLIDLEGHGREELFADVDVSRTVGWFTALYPVVLTRDSAEGPGSALKSVKEQLRKVPRRGIGYGLLRYLGGDARRPLAELPGAQVMFNYLGQVDQALSHSSRFGWAAESRGPSQSPGAVRSHLLDVRAVIADGCLQVSFQHSENVHRRETIERLAGEFLATLRALITHCQAADAGGYTPSDFELARLTQSEIDRHFAADRAIEDAYSLSPLQEGILFHCLRAPNSGAYVNHLVLRLGGALDTRAFHRAWDQLVARHTVLRTGFLWDKVSEPVQVVRRDTKVVWSLEDWRGADEERQRANLQAFLKSDRLLGFDLSKAPLIRLALIRIADDAYYFVWTYHHIVLDGWSAPLVLQEVLALYKANLTSTRSALPPVRPFRDYIAWLRLQDTARAEAYWRRTLAGFTTPTSMGAARGNGGGGVEVGNAEYQARLPVDGTRALKAFAREQDVTVNTVVQAAWSLLLSAYSGEEDVVYGAALSGRPAALSDVARIPGMFINTLPVRVVVDPDLSVGQWLGRLQKHQLELREFEYSALAQVQRWSQVGRAVPLFDVIVTFQNFPVDRTLVDEAARCGLSIGLVLSREQSTSPLTVFFELADELTVRFAYDPVRFDRAAIAGMGDRVLRLIEGIVSNGDANLMDLQIDEASEAPKLPAMPILPPSAEELELLGRFASRDHDAEPDAPGGKD